MGFAFHVTELVGFEKAIRHKRVEETLEGTVQKPELETFEHRKAK